MVKDFDFDKMIMREHLESVSYCKVCKKNVSVESWDNGKTWSCPLCENEVE